MTSEAITPASEPAEEHVPGRKECQILSAARAQFLEQGFSDTSMDAIARRAGVSKATLYAYFPSKEALFSHLIQAECREKCVTLPSPDLDEGIGPALHALCSHFVRHFLTKESTAFFQTVSGERWRFPDLCQLYFRSGRQLVVDFVAAYLEEAKAKGLLAFEDADLAADQLINLVLLDMPFRVALGLELRDQEEAERVMEAGLAVFFKAYGVAEAATT
ncbi:TetR/AcrR family transcriptional regulator [Methylosinus sp. Sm6]|uniref:TetR/AcrR family transcriptional regulator n=1 Tax=Methylosinus sp. Sm6 TaxID=2866948 RepID=UPI001C99C6E0|nr:TetR/AcrR family transcriptional regulator [Methylosinus sp. Sm6]MBY6242538.1 TetR/AcrR family transcriptional regulator [Methylosinus sp. Sm6]